MAYPDHLLARGERVILHKHPHWKVLILPILFFVVVIGGGFALAAVLRNWQYHAIAWIAIAVIGVVLLVLFCIVPFLRWRTEHFVITNHHVFFRTGILKRREHQIQLTNVQNIESTVSFWGRLLGFGSLIVESAADQPLEFENVAAISTVQSTLNQLIMDERRGYPDDGMGNVRSGYSQQGNPAQTSYPQQGYSPQAPPGYGSPSGHEPGQGGSGQGEPWPGYPPGEPPRRR